MRSSIPMRSAGFGRRQDAPKSEDTILKSMAFSCVRVSVFSRFCPGFVRNVSRRSSPPRGRPVCSWACRSSTFSSLITLAGTARQLGAGSISGATRTSVSSLQRTWAAALLYHSAFCIPPRQLFLPVRELGAIYVVATLDYHGKHLNDQSFRSSLRNLGIKKEDFWAYLNTKIITEPLGHAP